MIIEQSGIDVKLLVKITMKRFLVTDVDFNIMW
jgi:hypothetical protein